MVRGHTTRRADRAPELEFMARANVVIRRLPLDAAVIGLAMGLLATTGWSCKNKITAAPTGVLSTAPDEEAQRQANLDVIGGSALKAAGGVCDVNEVIKNPPPARPEWIIAELYKISLDPNEEAAFKRFRALFRADVNERDLKENYWGRMRKNVLKYVASAEDPSFTVCRKIPVDDGTKFFIKTNDPRQAPPPVTVGKVGNDWKIFFLTPF